MQTMTQLSPIAAAYVRSINDHDAATFGALFASDAVVHDAGREIRGIAAIHEWGEREIFAAEVTLEVVGTLGRDGATVVTAIVRGNFDKTGLPDPLIMDQRITEEGGKIAALTCGLTG